MAIYPTVSAYVLNNASNSSPSNPIDIEAWTEAATQSLGAVSLDSPNSIPNTSVSLAIDLDEPSRHKQDGNATTARHADNFTSGHRPHREPLRRDSQKRREALLKGKEGSRRRTRWENGLYHTQQISYRSCC